MSFARKSAKPERSKNMNLEPLPSKVYELLQRLHAPPRLIAHLTIVHDVAKTLIGKMDPAWAKS